MNHRDRDYRLVTAAALLGLAACSTDRAETGRQFADLDPCGAADHPCTLADVTPEAEARTELLAELVMRYLESSTDLEAVAEWLSSSDHVASVATGDEAIRFRVPGGRGHWILVRTLGSIQTLGAPTLPKPPRKESLVDVAPSLGSPPPRLVDPRPSTPASVAWEGTTQGQRKRALLLSPYRWQWEITGTSDGLDEVKETLRSRDYEDGVDLFTERLDPTNPACNSVERWDECRTVGEMSRLSAFTSWRQYKYIHLVSHGGAVSDGDAIKTGVATSWTKQDVLRERERADEAGDDDLVELIDQVGVEAGHIYVRVPREAIPWIGDGQTLEFDVSPLTVSNTEAEPGPVPLNPYLSESEKTLCRQALDAYPDSRRIEDARASASEEAESDAPNTVEQILIDYGLQEPPSEPSGREIIRDAMAQIDGKLCGSYEGRARTGRFIMLTTDFFEDTYPGGIDNAVIIMSACSSGFRTDLLEALDGDNTVVLGWSQSVSIDAAAEAGKLIASKLVEVDEANEDDSGLTVEQSIQAIRQLLDEAAQNPPTEAECETAEGSAAANCALQYGQPLSVLNDQPVDALTGAMLRVVGDSTLRAREIVYLVDGAGQDLANGTMLPAVGSAGDGRPDSVDVRIRVDGLGLEEDPQATPLEFQFEGRTIEVERPLRVEVAPGVWELPYRLPLGRDYQEGEAIDLEVVARLGDDGDSRWLYEDLRLVGSWFAYTVGGDAQGDQDGWIWVSTVSPTRADPSLGLCHVEINFMPAGQGLARLTALPLFGLTIATTGGLEAREYTVGVDESLGMDQLSMREANPETFFGGLTAKLVNPGSAQSVAWGVGGAGFWSTGGSVRIDHVDETRIAGSFDLTLRGLEPTDECAECFQPVEATARGDFAGPFAPGSREREILAQIRPPHEVVYNCVQ
jgi:hypothetical protein